MSGSEYRTREFHPDTVWRVYLLAESDTGEVRYVGKTMCPDARLAAHRSPGPVAPLRPWVMELRARGATVEMVIIHETKSQAQADIWEHDEVQKRLHLHGLLNKRLIHGRKKVLRDLERAAMSRDEQRLNGKS